MRARAQDGGMAYLTMFTRRDESISMSEGNSISGLYVGRKIQSENCLSKGFLRWRMAGVGSGTMTDSWVTIRDSPVIKQ